MDRRRSSPHTRGSHEASRQRTPKEPRRWHLWKGLLTEFDQGVGFVVVEETSPFPQNYFFELRGQNDHDEIAFQESHPKLLNGPFDLGSYSYEKGIVGYFADHYAAFWSYPYFTSGSATNRQVPIERLRRADICYPYCAQTYRPIVIDFGGALSLPPTQTRD